MSDSDMDIDDDEVGVQEQWREVTAEKDEHTIAGESEWLDRPVKASNSHNG